MAADLTIRQGTTLPAYTATVTDQTGAPLNLTTATSVTFVMRQLQTAAPAVKAAMTVVNAAAGQVQYSWQATDTAVPGLYMAEIQVVLPGGTYTFPNVGYQSIEMTPSLTAAGQQLITVEDAKDELNITVDYDMWDTKLLRWVAACRPVIENIVGPVIQQTFDEWHDGGTPTIMLRRTPSAALGATPIIILDACSEYVGPIEWPLAIISSPDQGQLYSCMLEPQMGRVVRRTAGGGVQAFPSGPDQVHVVYTAGQQIVPDNVAQATRELLRVNFQHTQQRFIPGAGAGAGEDTEDQVIPDPPSSFFVPGRVYELLEPNRRAPSCA